MQSLIYDNMAHESSETLIWTEWYPMGDPQEAANNPIVQLRKKFLLSDLIGPKETHQVIADSYNIRLKCFGSAPWQVSDICVYGWSLIMTNINSPVLLTLWDNCAALSMLSDVRLVRHI